MTGFTVIHDECKGSAFHLTQKPQPFEPLRSSIVRHLDGSPAAPQEPVICETCGKPFRPRIGDIQPSGQSVTP